MKKKDSKTHELNDYNAVKQRNLTEQRMFYLIRIDREPTSTTLSHLN